MKEPVVLLPVPHKDKDDRSNVDSNDGMDTSNDLSGLEARGGTRVTLDADFNNNMPNPASVQKDTT